MARTQDTVNAEDVLDWASVIDAFAKQHDMSERETLKWISERTSLQVACEVFGVPLSPSIATRYTREDELTLGSLGDILHAAGFKVPRLMEHHRLGYKPKEAKRVGFSLSREEYLLERAAGKSKNRIAHDQGISGPALFHWLEKWNLKDSEVEARAIEQLTGVPRTVVGVPVAADANSARTATSTSEKALEPQRLVVLGRVDSTDTLPLSTTLVYRDGALANSHGTVDGMPVGTTPSRNGAAFTHVVSRLTGTRPTVDGVHPSVVASEQHAASPADIAVQLPVDIVMRLALTSESVHSAADGLSSTERISQPVRCRDDIMQDALAGLLDAMKLAYRELADMLGEEEARQHIQHYASRQVERFLSQFP